MVKIAVMVSSYAELQFEISEEINLKFQKNIAKLRPNLSSSWAWG